METQAANNPGNGYIACGASRNWFMYDHGVYEQGFDCGATVCADILLDRCPMAVNHGHFRRTAIFGGSSGDGNAQKP